MVCHVTTALGMERLAERVGENRRANNIVDGSVSCDERVLRFVGEDQKVLLENGERERPGDPRTADCQVQGGEEHQRADPHGAGTAPRIESADPALRLCRFWHWPRGPYRDRRGQRNAGGPADGQGTATRISTPEAGATENAMARYRLMAREPAALTQRRRQIQRRYGPGLVAAFSEASGCGSEDRDAPHPPTPPENAPRFPPRSR